MAGGLGSRLGSITRELPKPLIPVSGRPFLGLLIRKLRRDGFSEIVVVVGHLAEAVESYLAEAESELGQVTTVYSHLGSTPGTAHAFEAGIRALAAGDVLLLNGDTILDIDYGDLLRTHRDSGRSMTIATTARKGVPNEGAVRISQSDEVIVFQEGRRFPAAHPAVRARLRAAGSGTDRFESNCGCYVISIDETIDDQLAKGSREPDRGSFEATVIPVLAFDGRVHAYSIKNRLFLDFGTVENLGELPKYDTEIRRIYNL